MLPPYYLAYSTTKFETTFCKALDAPLNGNAPVYSDSQYHGSVAAFACKTGYTLSSKSPLLCAGGSWSSDAPLCEGGGNDVVTGAPTAKPADGGGDSSVDTTAPTDKPANGDDPTPVAQPTAAPVTTKPVNPADALCHAQSAPLDGFPPILTQNLRHGSIASFKCQTGYKLKGFKEILCAGGKWSDDAPTCQPYYFNIDGSGVELGDSSTGALVPNIRCVTDGVGAYGNNEHALVTILHPGKIVTKGYFGTECDVKDHTQSYDVLRINGVEYSCHHAPEHLSVAAGDLMTWSTSLNRNHVGWTLCHEEDDRDRSQ